MAVYNCADTIDEALASLVGQTFQDWELILCDDASTDGTHERLLAFASDHADRVTVLRNAVNSKLAYSLNRCLEAATGTYVARMDGDDVSVPERLEKQVAYLDAHPDVDLVGTAMQRFDRSGRKDIVSLDSEPGRRSLKRGVPFAHATIVARRSVYQALGGYMVTRRTERCEDYDLWFRFVARGHVGHNLVEPLYLVREDEGAIRRRTIAGRWNLFRTTLAGFRLLGYPWRWYAWPTVALLKSFVPARIVSRYRARQHHSFENRVRSGTELGS
jgi:glycosyltransferase EpsE